MSCSNHFNSILNYEEMKDFNDIEANISNVSPKNPNNNPGPFTRWCPGIKINRTYDKWSVIIYGFTLLCGLILMILFALKIIKI